MVAVGVLVGTDVAVGVDVLIATIKLGAGEMVTVLVGDGITVAVRVGVALGICAT